MKNDPVPEIPPAAEAASSRDAVLIARCGDLERELETAPYHRVGTFWWDERTKEVQSLKRRLAK